MVDRPHPSIALPLRLAHDIGRQIVSGDRMEGELLPHETELAAQFDVPMACVRAVTDRVHDEFLAPFSYEPSLSLAARAMRILVAGDWVRRHGQWRENTAVARRSLRRFLASYLGMTIDE